MKRLKRDIAILNDERLTTNYLRVFLSRLTMRFHNLILSILNDSYFNIDRTFFNNNDVKHYLRRLRALAHRHNTKFFNRIRKND